MVVADLGHSIDPSPASSQSPLVLGPLAGLAAAAALEAAQRRQYFESEAS